MAAVFFDVRFYSVFLFKCVKYQIKLEKERQSNRLDRFKLCISISIKVQSFLNAALPVLC